MYYKAEICVCKSVSLSSRLISNEDVWSFKLSYKDTREGFLEDIEAIFSKIDLDFLK